MREDRLQLAEVLAIRSCNAEHRDARRMWMLLMENVLRALEESDDGNHD